MLPSGTNLRRQAGLLKASTPNGTIAYGHDWIALMLEIVFQRASTFAVCDSAFSR